MAATPLSPVGRASQAVQTACSTRRSSSNIYLIPSYTGLRLLGICLKPITRATRPPTCFTCRAANCAANLPAASTALPTLVGDFVIGSQQGHKATSPPRLTMLRKACGSSDVNIAEHQRWHLQIQHSVQKRWQRQHQG